MFYKNSFVITYKKYCSNTRKAKRDRKLLNGRGGTILIQQSCLNCKFPCIKNKIQFVETAHNSSVIKLNFLFNLRFCICSKKSLL